MPKESAAGKPHAMPPPISAATLWVFRRVVRQYFRRHFRSVLLQSTAEVAALRSLTGPLIVFANHSSWWDPMVSVLLAETLLPGRRHYAPMDAAALERYPVLKRIGIFPVEMQTARGAVQFLRTSTAILAGGGVVWITPQGRFADARAPLEFKPGLGALAARLEGVACLPLAIEYAFWDERLPETFLRLAAPVRLAAGASAEQATATLQAALAETMAALRSAVVAREVSAFAVLLTGSRGTGGLYALARRLRGWVTGRRVSPDHTPRRDDEAPGGGEAADGGTMGDSKAGDA